MATKRKTLRERRRRQRTSILKTATRASELRETEAVEKLAYSRRQAAEALGVSVSTIDRRVVPLLDTVKAPWGQRLIPVRELERFLVEHVQVGGARPARRSAGRPPALPDSVVARIRQEHVEGRSFGEIARALTSDGVPTANGGRRWWPSTVRNVLLRRHTPASI